MIGKYTLNVKQQRAFQIIAEHSLQPKPKPLRMFLNGPGGTGKSTVINALCDFFDSHNQSWWFRLASYTGVVAKNVSGLTLHSALMLHRRGRCGAVQSVTSRDLVSMWQGVDYLFIDKVSMVGSKMLVQISEALFTFASLLEVTQPRNMYRENYYGSPSMSL
ncbi:hypothetical protein ARMGADRAFT_1047804 [Armillaria gallica]|uniref:ATP-dependent DNA helicase n=1 Tax=Armillaria gallica TaxID=47427 RepID=A0A2H3D5S5_ARMGA|nr:hypothetical protein ARMGADRAFT_1047804 [Armillaria gallica]